MRYTVLTYVPRREIPVACGKDVAVGIRELGCAKCVVDGLGKLKPCWEHKNERILWAVTVEEPEEEINNVALKILPTQIERLPEVGDPTRTEELLEVS